MDPLASGCMFQCLYPFVCFGPRGRRETKMSSPEQASISRFKSLRSLHTNTHSARSVSSVETAALLGRSAPITPAQNQSTIADPNQQANTLEESPSPTLARRPEIIQTTSSSTKTQSNSSHDNGETGSGAEKDDSTNRHKLRSDKTSWIHTASLWGFCLVFLLMICALFLLRHYALSIQGFGVSTSTTSYLWKYAPTAVFVVVIAFWRQIDYRCKIQAPWIEMWKGFSPAQKTVLLDYVSPLLPTSFFLSLTNAHFEVTASIAIFALLKAAVLFSTGLLVLQNTTLRHQNAILSLDRGGSGNPNKTSAQYTMLYYGATERGLQWPARTGPVSAFQELSSANNLPAGSIVTTDVLGFFPWITCEIAYMNQTFASSALEATFQSEDCSGTLSAYAFPCEAANEICTPLQIFGGMKTTYCSTLDYFGDGLDNALIIYLLGVENSQVLAPSYNETNSGTVNVTAWSQSIPWTSALVCATNYAIEKAHLTVDTANPTLPGHTNISDPFTSTYDTINGYTFGNLTTDFYNSYLPDWNTLPKPTDTLSSETLDYSGIDTFLGLMMYQASVTDIFLLRNTTLMYTAAQQVFRGLSSQLVGSWLSFPQHLTTQGSYTYTEPRLHIHDPSLWGMAISLALAVVCIVVILSLRNPFVLPWQKDGLLSRALTLRRSQRLHEVCMRLGHLSDKNLANTLIGSSFALVSGSLHWLCIEAKLDGPAKISSPKNNTLTGSDVITWRPLPSRIWFTVVAMAFPIAVIVALEIVQHFSDANDGIADAQNSTSLTVVMSSYIPALILLTIAAIYSSAEFAVSLLSPHLLMKAGTATIHTAGSSPLRDLSIFAILKALSRRQIAVAVIMISAIFGSILTIISSGLYEISTIPIAHETFVSTADQFFLGWNEPTNAAAEAMFTLIQRHNSSYPSGTSDEILYPFFSLDSSNPIVDVILQSNSSNSIEVEMPVIRPSLNCTVVPGANLTVQVGHNGLDSNDTILNSPWINITSYHDLPEHCQFSPGVYQHSKRFKLETTGAMKLRPGQTVLAGECGSPLPENSTESGLVLFAPDCPSAAFTFGKFKIDDTKIGDITRLVCSQYQEEIPATLSFVLPSLALNPSQPPILDENRSKVVKRTSYDFNQLFWTQEIMDLYINDEDSPLDVFFTFLEYGVNGMPLSELVGVENQPMLLNATQHLYRQFMVQVVNEAMRLNATNSTTQDDAVTQIGAKLAAKIFDHSRLRIVQNKTSKFILQGVLAAMVVCWAFGFKVLRETGQLVAHNPCTTMGALSLWAGSELVDSLPEDGDCDDKRLMERYKDVRFRLCLWPGEEKSGDMSAAVVTNSDQNARPSSATRFGIDIVDVSKIR
jgi:hypothetical protein